MARMDRNRLIALFWLAVTFWIHLFDRLVAWVKKTPREGLKAFTGNYRADGIWPIEADDRAAMPNLGDCVSCRLCDTVCPPMHAENGMGFVGPSRLVLANDRLPSAVAAWIDPFLCIRCRACDDACPQGVRIDRMVGRMRGAVAREARDVVPAELRDLVARVAERGHVQGEAPAAPRRDVSKADYTYVASCAGGAADVAAETSLLERAGIDFATAPAQCCGAVGQVACHEPATRLRDALAAARALNVVTADPRCFEYFKTSPAYRDLQVSHVLELTTEVRGSGEPEEAPKVTYHDPCQLARAPGGEVFPREAIRRAGGELVEMRDHGRAAPCCGMSGGTWTFNPKLAEELGRARVRQAVATGAPVLLTQSAMCRDHLARCAELEGAKIEVRNVTEFLAQRAKVPTNEPHPAEAKRAS